MSLESGFSANGVHDEGVINSFGLSLNITRTWPVPEKRQPVTHSWSNTIMSIDMGPNDDTTPYSLSGASNMAQCVHV